ncbi:polar amino acid transport system substrate-binding protein [Rhizobium halophytocola]|uniref:Polar amino acid transport system substrate-binding protein n=1 Tax=Rhizobium halophytocola TaxID=735519 RepID=A0ABS4E0K8_9HYPH|nr:polar amino acid transport system substrate-binding protein [Rhizobium halophytocola]
MPNLGHTAETSRDFLVMFDKGERIARPDLSTLPRLRFLTSTDFPPFNFTDQTGRLSGFHVDLVRALCAELNLTAKCQIQALPYADLEAALKSGEGEAVIAGVAQTDDLRQDFDFSRPFMQLPARFALRDAAKPVATDISDLFGRRVGVTAGTRHEAMLKAFFPDVKPVPFESREKRDAALLSGDIDAVFGDGLQLSFWTHSEAAKTCCSLFGGPYFSEHFLGEGLTIMTGKGNADLAPALDSALAAVSRNGQLQDIYDRYFPYDLYGRTIPKAAEAALRGGIATDPSDLATPGNGTPLEGGAGQPVEPQPVSQ